MTTTELAETIAEAYNLYKESKGEFESSEHFSIFFDGIQLGFVCAGVSEEMWWEAFDIAMEL